MKLSSIFLATCAAAMAGIGIWLLVEGADTPRVLAALGGAAAMAALPIIDRWLNVKLPLWLQVWYGLFILGSLLLGTTFDMYGRWWPWDGVLHLLSGILVAGFGIVLLHQRFGKLKVVLPVWGRIVLIGMFSVTVAFLWEVAEFASDNFFGTLSQNNSVEDTMLDMIYATSTGLLTAIFYYGFIRVRKSHHTHEHKRSK